MNEGESRELVLDGDGFKIARAAECQTTSAGHVQRKFPLREGGGRGPGSKQSKNTLG